MQKSKKTIQPELAWQVPFGRLELAIMTDRYRFIEGKSQKWDEVSVKRSRPIFLFRPISQLKPSKPAK